MDTKANVLVICPHPDDAEFSSAGTIARWVKEGRLVAYVICTSGDKGTSDYTIKPEVLAAMREKEQLAAARVLGVKDVVFLRYPDQGLEDTPGFRKDLVRYIRTFRPETLMCPDPYRKYLWHRDHRITGIVALDAVYPYARDHLAYPDMIEEGLQPHKVHEVFCWAPMEDINYRSDITTTFDLKLAALRCHESQVGGQDWSKVVEWVKGRAREMAKGQPFELAEAFHRVEITW